jgi:hypothetical protein
MVIAVSSTRAVQMAIDEIIHVIAMRNSCVSAVGAVFVSAVMTFALVLWCAGSRVGC